MSEVLAVPSNRWEVKPLSDLAEAIQYGYTAKAKTDAAGIRYLRITDIQDDHVEWSTVPSCDVSEVESEKYLLAAGDLVFARTGATVGKSFLIRGNIPKSVFASYLIRVRLRKHIDPRYVAHFFQSPSYWNQIAESSAGIGQPNVNGTKLAQIQIPVAPLDRQAEIVAELEKQFSRLDEAVANLQRVKANLKRYKASVLKAAVEGRLVETEAALARREGRTFETGEQLLQRILEERRAKWAGRGAFAAESPSESLEFVPDGWAVASLDQLSTVVRGGSPRPAGDPRYFGGSVPWITVGSITADETDYLRYANGGLTEAGKERSRFIEEHTLLLTNSGATLGVPKISLIAGCINDGVAALLDVEYPLKHYLVHYLRTKTDALRQVNQGAAQPNLNTTIIKAMVVPLPPVAEQARIVAEVDRHLSIIREVEAEVDTNLQRAQALRQSTLAKAFST